MSKYTTELRYICEVCAGKQASEGYNSIDEIIDLAIPNIFNFSFPIFDEEYRLPLEKKILRHFYTREISEETVGLWKLRLEDKLNIIMPYYNQLYRSELIEFNPMYDTDLHKEHTREYEGDESGTNNERVDTDNNSVLNRTETLEATTADVLDRNVGTTVDTNTSDTETYSENSTIRDVVHDENESTSHDTGWNLFSDTPQTGLSGLTGGSDDPLYGGLQYLTNATRTIADNHSTFEGDKTDNRTESSTKQGTKSGEVDSLENVEEDTRRDIEYDKNISENRSYETDDVRVTAGTDTRHSENVEDYAERVFGKQSYVSYSKMLVEFRETFLNIDAMVLEELEPLFFGIW